jgi:hypothetical protein
MEDHCAVRLATGWGRGSNDDKQDPARVREGHAVCPYLSRIGVESLFRVPRERDVSRYPCYPYKLYRKHRILYRPSDRDSALIAIMGPYFIFIFPALLLRVAASGVSASSLLQTIACC